MEITEGLVRRLVDAQFPQWAGLPVTGVPRQGNDNRTFRLGSDLAVRLPSHERYVAGIAKEGIAAMEVCEVSPPYDISDVTSLMGVRLMMDVLGSMAKNGRIGGRLA